MKANLIMFLYRGVQVSIEREPCPRCAECSHTESVTLTERGEETGAVLRGAAAAVVWEWARREEAAFRARDLSRPLW